MPPYRLPRFFLNKQLVLLIVGIFSCSMLFAQTKSSEEIANSLLPKIELALEETTQDSTNQYILALVNSACKEQDSLKIDVLKIVMSELESRFNLLAAVFIGEEIVEIAETRQDEENEANARFNLHRYYNALGNSKEATEHIERALVLYTKRNNHYKIMFCKVYMILDSRNYRSDEEILLELNVLLQECIKDNDVAGQNILHQRLVSINLANGNLIQAEKSIEALELIIKQNPGEKIKATSVLHTSLYRAGFELAKKDTAEAISHYKKTLKISRQEPDLWVEVYVMQTLATIYLSISENETAKKYLKNARVKALAINALDLISQNYLIESMLAEQERRFEEAYSYINKHYDYANLHDERSNGFDLKNHFLSIEKEQLETEQKQKELELAFQKSQVKYTTVLSLLALIVALALFIAFRKYRKGNKKLALQNETITQQSLALKEMDKAKSRFFANISHELRTPLTLLISPIKSLLDKEGLTERQYKLLDIANQSGKQLEALINEILDLRKLESGKMKPNLQPTKLSDFCLNYISQFESLAKQKSIEYTYHNTLETDALVKIDREKWRQIMLNLIANAFKFTPAGGMISVTTKIENDTLQFSVNDSGEGIDSEDLPKIFDLYFQSEKASSNKAGGTGIGLTLCYEYAQLFKGTLDVESTFGKGSRFTFTLPLLQVEPEELTLETNLESLISPIYQTEVEPQKRKNVTAKPTVLIVEDNVALQKYISLILGDAYNLLLAANGQEALSVISSTKQIHLIVTDLMMPVMDGYGLIAELKKTDQTSSIPLILLTARTEIETKLKALHFGIDDYLTKPFDERELVARIENLLSAQKSRRAEEEQEADDVSTISIHENEAWISHFEAYIRMHLDNTSLSIPEIASEFAMSESSLLRKVKICIGLTPIQYLKEMRLDEARKLLEQGTVSSIKAVAAKSGFKDTSTFSRNYSKRYGKLPSDY